METLTFKIISSSKGKTKNASIIMEGALTIENTENIKKQIINNIDKYSTFDFNLINVKDIDLSFLQLLYAIKTAFKKSNKIFHVQFNLQPEVKKLIDFSGFSFLFV